MDTALRIVQRGQHGPRVARLLPLGKQHDPISLLRMNSGNDYCPRCNSIRVAYSTIRPRSMPCPEYPETLGSRKEEPRKIESAVKTGPVINSIFAVPVPRFHQGKPERFARTKTAIQPGINDTHVHVYLSHGGSRSCSKP